MLFLFLIFLVINQITTLQECLNENFDKKFIKIRECARSSTSIISYANYRNLNRCLTYARARNALAVNFSPPEASLFRGKSYKYPCQLLSCPEIQQSNLINDSAYDYYSFYKNLTEEFICVKSVGIYKLFKEKMNYFQAIKTCQSLNGDLAQVQSEILTNSLSGLISGEIKNWTKLVFIGLDDKSKRGEFITSFGNQLRCYKYRAWAPGHPRFNKRKNCVVLDSDKTWKSTSCRNKLPFLCEIHPYSSFYTKRSKDCSKINDLNKKEKCENRKIEIREDKCTFF